MGEFCPDAPLPRSNPDTIRTDIMHDMATIRLDGLELLRTGLLPRVDGR